MGIDDFEREVESRLEGAVKIVVLAVGDDLDPSDRVGISAGREISSAKLKGVKVLLTSRMPENFTSIVRREKPSHVVIIDAAEIGGRPGDFSLIEPGRLAATRVSTHAMPLSLLMDYLAREMGVKVLLVGIQPTASDDLSAGGRSSAAERGIRALVSILKKSVPE